MEVVNFDGLDVFYLLGAYQMEDLCDSHEVPALLADLYAKGKYGVKTNEGFYNYENGRDLLATQERDDKLLKLFEALCAKNINTVI